MKILIRLFFITSVLLFSYDGYSQQENTLPNNSSDLDEIINTLHTFEIDKEYKKKIKKTVDYLLREYPEIFLEPMHTSVANLVQHGQWRG